MTSLTLAVSERGFQRAFRHAVTNASFSGSKSQDFGAFSAGYNLAAHLENGRVDFRADGGLIGSPNGAVSIEELDIVWDRLDVTLGLDIPRLCVGGFCIIPSPFGGCLVRAPRICVFTADPDISITLPLGLLTRTELSVMGSLRATLNGAGTRWDLNIDPVTIDLDLMDWPDIVGDLIEDAVGSFIDAVVPSVLRPLVHAILGSVTDVVRAILDIGDDIQEWLSRTLGISLGLFDFLITVVADLLASNFPVHRIPTPFEILPATAEHTAVSVAIDDIAIQVTDDEFVATVDIGATTP